MKIKENTYYLVLAYPDEYLPKFISTFKDISDNYHILYDLKQTDFTVVYLINIISDYFFSGKRKSKIKTTKFLYKILKNYDGEFVADIKDKLFELFKSLSQEQFVENWKVWICLKNLVLSENQVAWLLNNSQNQLVLNRILRYPVHNDKISEWCKEQLKNDNVLNDIYPEYISQTIKDLSDFYNYCETKSYSIDILANCLKYCKISEKEKEAALNKLLSIDRSNCTISKIAYNLNLYSVIKNQFTGITI